MHFKEFFSWEKWKTKKKTDWLILALIGVLLLIIAMPVGNTKKTKTEKETNSTVKKSEVDYQAQLEQQLTQILGKMKGVGEVEVMITLSDEGEHVVEKDMTRSDNSQMENSQTDKSQSDSTQSESQETSIYEENEDGSTPYVSKEIKPKVEGVLVVAQGGDSATIRQNISKAALALFSVEAHKIVVVEMNE